MGCKIRHTTIKKPKKNVSINLATIFRCCDRCKNQNINDIKKGKNKQGKTEIRAQRLTSEFVLYAFIYMKYNSSS